jgi:Fe-S-cluster containining protein
MTAATARHIEDGDLLRALLYAHDRANANTAQVHRANAAVTALAELLVNEGLLDAGAVDRHTRAAEERLKREYFDRGMAVALQEFDVSKYDFEGGAEIDCESRLPLCRAACCRLPLALSQEDLREGVLRWDLGRPYLIAHGDDSYCVHMDRGTHACTAYDQRPIPCRGYDCRQDERIWIDFERRIVNPDIHDPDWPDSACSTTSTAR